MNKAGVSLWRQIGEALAEEIEQGVHVENERLPPLPSWRTGSP